MPENAPLHCLVCGYERGGTTLVSELIRQDPGIDGRFEGGLLLAATPSDFATLEPYASGLKRFWHLDDDDMAYICSALDWREAYARLRERSDVPRKDVALYDKTPAYMPQLVEVLGKVDVPAVCVVRDPRALYWSHWKHKAEQGGELEKPDIGYWARHYYVRYAERLRLAQRRYPDRILVVQLEELVVHPLRISQQIYEFLGLNFSPEFVHLPATSNPYVARGGIVRDVIHEYRRHLSKKDQWLLRLYTRTCAEWHWTGGR